MGTKLGKMLSCHRRHLALKAKRHFNHLANMRSSDKFKSSNLHVYKTYGQKLGQVEFWEEAQYTNASVVTNFFLTVNC